MGYVTIDPFINYTATGRLVANFTMVTMSSRVFKGEKRDEPEYHYIAAWGQAAEVVEKYVTKNCLVWIEGSKKTSFWIDKDGRKRSKVRIHTRDIHLLDKGQKEIVTVPANLEDQGFDNVIESQDIKDSTSDP